MNKPCDYLKTMNRVGIVLTLLLFFSCTEVYFESPQPFAKKDENKFPKKFRGSWGNDELSIVVNKKTIEFIETEKKVLHRSSINENGYELKGKLIRELKDTNKVFQYLLSDDSVHFDYITSQRIGLSDSLVLRRVNGNYFLNICDHENGEWWEMYWLKGTENEIRVMQLGEDVIDRLKPFKNLEEVFFLEKDEEGIFNPKYSEYWKGTLTLEQINQLISLDGFEETGLLLEPYSDRK